jgi:cyclopropane-fatty-acyl-phospholipid synthase
VAALGTVWWRGNSRMRTSSRYPISNSQREYIEAEAIRRGLANLRVITADMNTFDATEQFDRIVSVEMFEHMMNWRELLKRLRS